MSGFTFGKYDSKNENPLNHYACLINIRGELTRFLKVSLNADFKNLKETLGKTLKIEQFQLKFHNDILRFESGLVDEDNMEYFFNRCRYFREDRIVCIEIIKMDDLKK
jgi:hypothetical protein